ncbi:hypothetical protein [Tepidibacillus fermentans]|uniref:Uncharacterized protein n=1 Tax=Tepidibacillus fermentans TaxID=1281767 RepID=A0A4R3KBK8_9BACI|nr:hypothetical protein [Tepidibacillus fermentans]TCS80380.1 hypothetical protein EDD72_11747 [Tepidibacillus fermentans]
MRTKVITFAGKTITVEEKKIGELEQLLAKLFPATKGKIKDLGKALDNLEIDWDLLYKKIPAIFPDITETDVKNAYISELEELIQAFIEVNFFGLKKLIPKLVSLVQLGSTQK